MARSEALLRGSRSRAVVAITIVCALMVGGVNLGSVIPGNLHASLLPSESVGSSIAGTASGTTAAVSGIVTNWSALKNIYVGNGILGIAYDWIRGEIFTANTQTDNLSVLSVATGQIVKNISVGTNPQAVAYDPVTGKVFVANYGTNNVSVISDTTNAVVATIPVGGSPDRLVYDSGKGEMFVSNYNSANLTVISDATDAVVASVPIAQIGSSEPSGMAYDPALGEVFVAVQFHNEVDVVSDVNNSVVASIPVGIRPVDAIYDPGAAVVFVQNYGSNNISELSPVTNTVIRTIPGGQEPDASAIDSAAGEIAIANQFSDNVSILSDVTDSVVESIPNLPGTNPEGVAFVNSTGQFFVTDGGRLTVIGTPPPMYGITFSESGLQSGTSWSVTLSGTPQTSMTSTVTFTEPNGTYSFALGTVAGYTTSPSSGSVTVNGGPVSEPIAFASTVTGQFAVTFTESGLPSGTSWTVTLKGSPQTSATSTVTFTEPNGTYSYSVGPTSGYGPNPSNGTLTVSGATVSIPVTYSKVFAVTFTETALPSGTNWSVTLTGKASAIILVASLASTPGTLTRWSDGASTIRFYVSNGTYSYSSAAPGYSGNAGGLTVNGQSPAPATVGFTASSSSSSGIPILDYAIIGVVVVVVAVGVVVALLRRRGSGASGRASPPSKPVPGGPDVPPPST